MLRADIATGYKNGENIMTYISLCRIQEDLFIT